MHIYEENKVLFHRCLLRREKAPELLDGWLSDHRTEKSAPSWLRNSYYPVTCASLQEPVPQLWTQQILKTSDFAGICIEAFRAISRSLRRTGGRSTLTNNDDWGSVKRDRGSIERTRAGVAESLQQ